MNIREQRERGQARVKYWELGTAAGAKEKETQEAQKERQEMEASLRKIETVSWNVLYNSHFNSFLVE